MTITPIDVGLIANDGTGDDLREAFIKINNNFDEIDLRTSMTTVSNVGLESGTGLYKETVGSDLRFRKLAVNPAYPNSLGIELSPDENTVYIWSPQNSLSFTNGVVTQSSDISNPVYFTGTEAASTSITTRNNGEDIEVVVDSQLVRETAPRLNAHLDAQGNDLVNVSNINNNDISLLDNVIGFDFGTFSNVRSGIIDFIVNSVDADLGTIPEDKPDIVDLGNLPGIS
jgi:hypothetical protein